MTEHNGLVELETPAKPHYIPTHSKKTFRFPSQEDLIWISTSMIHFSPVPKGLKLAVPVCSTAYSFLKTRDSATPMSQFEHYNSAIAESLYGKQCLWEHMVHMHILPLLRWV